MTVAANDRATQFLGDGVTVAFDYDFPVLTEAGLEVVVDGAVVSSSLYSVDLELQRVTFDTAPANAAAGLILGKTTATQTVVYSRQNGSANLEGIAAQLDVIVKALQEVVRDGQRSVKTDYAASGPLIPASEVGKGLAWAPDGSNRLVNVAVDGAAAALALAAQAAAEAAQTLAEAAKDDAEDAATAAASEAANAAASAAAAASTLASALLDSDVASAANYRAAVANKVLETDSVWDAMAEVALTDAATIVWDMSLGFDFTVTLGGSRTLDNPTNTTVGKRGRIRVVQDGTGGHTLAKSSNHKTAGGVGLTIASAAGAETYIYYDCVSSTKVLLSNSLLAWS